EAKLEAGKVTRMLTQNSLPSSLLLTISAQVPQYSVELAHQVRNAIEAAVERNVAYAVLLSGGLDTSIVASIASRRGPLKAYTVALEDAPSPDNEYARLMANRLKLNHKLHVFELDGLMRTLHEVMG